jgi:hypothetical protein
MWEWLLFVLDQLNNQFNTNDLVTTCNPQIYTQCSSLTTSTTSSKKLVHKSRQLIQVGPIASRWASVLRMRRLISFVCTFFACAWWLQSGYKKFTWLTKEGERFSSVLILTINSPFCRRHFRMHKLLKLIFHIHLHALVNKIKLGLLCIKMCQNFEGNSKLYFCTRRVH